MDLRVHLSHAGDNKLFASLLSLFLDPFIVLLGQLGEALKGFNVLRMLVSVGIHFETIGPATLVQVQKHLLLPLILAIVDSDRVIVLIKPTHNGNRARMCKVANIRCSLSGFKA